MNEELDVASVSVSVAVESTIQYMCDTTRNEIMLLGSLRGDRAPGCTLLARSFTEAHHFCNQESTQRKCC